jgi:hypothetical protein
MMGAITKLGYRPMPADFPDTFIRVGQTARNPTAMPQLSAGQCKAVQEITMTKPFASINEMLGGVRKFGRLTFVEEIEPLVRPDDGSRIRRGIFSCACGRTKLLRIDNVKRGRTRSCGCLNLEVLAALNRSRSR